MSSQIKHYTTRSNRIKNSFQDHIFDIINIALVSIVFIVIIYPLIFVISASFSDPVEVMRGRVWLLPRGFTIEGYKRVLVYADLWRSYANTIFYAFSGAFVVLFFTLPAAYGFSKDGFPFKKTLIFIFMFTMFFGGGLVPYYMLINNLGLINSYITLPLLGAVSFTYIIIARTFFKTSIPQEILDAAAIDGCSNFASFFRIVLPLSKPIIAVIALWAAVTQWNGYFTALLFLTERYYQPLQIILREILIISTVDFSQIVLGGEQAVATMERHQIAQLVKYTVMIVSSVPIIMFYPFIQRYFVKGIMIGSLKG